MTSIRITGLAALAAVAAQPALAASEYGFFSLRNTDFVVLLAFLLVAAIILRYRVPALIGGLLDRRAETISRDLAEARALRDEAQQLLASFELKQREVAAQSDRIVAEARAESERAAAEARANAARAVQRRVTSAEEQISAAEARAIRAVRDRAVTVAVAAAREVLAARMTQAESDRLIEDSIDTVAQRLN